MSLTTIRIPTITLGLTPFHLVSANTTNAAVVKTSQGQLYGWAITNTNAAARYICFHNSSVAPVAGVGVLFKYGIPATGASNQSFDFGIQFSGGISITTVVNPADSDNTAVGLNDLVINLFFN